ncbi:MAG: hypothetical protein PCFJNLEI_01518 [Verrucomicrobiae bacterium]|nr:hypothetical protein [Verrucomicrobiae bacterium]
MRRKLCILSGVVTLGAWIYLCGFACGAPTLIRQPVVTGIWSLPEDRALTHAQILDSLDPVTDFMFGYRDRVLIASTVMMLGFAGVWCFRERRVEPSAGGNAAAPRASA